MVILILERASGAAGRKQARPVGYVVKPSLEQAAKFLGKEIESNLPQKGKVSLKDCDMDLQMIQERKTPL